MRELKAIALVGAGPGSIDLITVRGLRYLQAAQVVLADALVDPEFKHCAPNAIWIDVGKRGGKLSCAQDRIDAQLLIFARCGFKVVRLKGGDPSLFARAEEEIAALKGDGFDFEIVPGVTSALAAAAEAKAPLTRRGRGRSVIFQTAVTRRLSSTKIIDDLPIDSPDAASGIFEHAQIESPSTAPTLVLYMAGQHIAQLKESLHDAGWTSLTAVRLVSNAGSELSVISSGRIEDLPRLAGVHNGQPTIVIVGVGAEDVTAKSPALGATAKVECLATFSLR